MADRVRGDLVAVAVEIVHIVDALANLFGRAAEIDAGIAPALMRTLVEAAVAVGEKLMPLTKNGEVDAVAVPVQLGGKVGEFLPALELGAIVEGDDDELRRAVDARLRRHRMRKQQQAQRGNDCPRSQSSPPTVDDSESICTRSASRIERC